VFSRSDHIGELRICRVTWPTFFVWYVNDLTFRAYVIVAYRMNAARSKFLIESEVAAILGRSSSKIKRLRLARELSYLPGRPVLIMERWLDEYLERLESARAAKAARKQKADEEAKNRHQRMRIWLQVQRHSEWKRRHSIVDNSPWVPRKPKK
jgi:hypothetical protein